MQRFRPQHLLQLKVRCRNRRNRKMLKNREEEQMTVKTGENKMEYWSLFKYCFSWLKTPEGRKQALFLFALMAITNVILAGLFAAVGIPLDNTELQDVSKQTGENDVCYRRFVCCRRNSPRQHRTARRKSNANGCF